MLYGSTTDGPQSLKAKGGISLNEEPAVVRLVHSIRKRTQATAVSLINWAWWKGREKGVSQSSFNSPQRQRTRQQGIKRSCQCQPVLVEKPDSTCLTSIRCPCFRHPHLYSHHWKAWGEGTCCSIPTAPPETFIRASQSTRSTHHVGTWPTHSWFLTCWLLWRKYLSRSSCCNHRVTRQRHKHKSLATVCGSERPKEALGDGLPSSVRFPFLSSLSLSKDRVYLWALDRAEQVLKVQSPDH